MIPTPPSRRTQIDFRSLLPKLLQKATGHLRPGQRSCNG